MNTRIKDFRISLKMNQSEFGDKLGVSRDVISNIELGRVEAKDPFIKLLCKEFNVSELWIRTGDGEMYIELDRDDELVQWVGTLVKPDNDDDKEFIKNFLNILRKLDVSDWKSLEKIALLMAEIKEKD